MEALSLPGSLCSVTFLSQLLISMCLFMFQVSYLLNITSSKNLFPRTFSNEQAALVPSLPCSLCSSHYCSLTVRWLHELLSSSLDSKIRVMDGHAYVLACSTARLSYRGPLEIFAWTKWMKIHCWNPDASSVSAFAMMTWKEKNWSCGMD